MTAAASSACYETEQRIFLNWGDLRDNDTVVVLMFKLVRFCYWLCLNGFPAKTINDFAEFLVLTQKEGMQYYIKTNITSVVVFVLLSDSFIACKTLVFYLVLQFDVKMHFIC